MDKHIADAVPFTRTPPPLWQPPAWREALPVLAGPRARLRELRHRDAATLLGLMRTPEVSRFISAPPTAASQFGAFIEWGHRERQAGRYAGFALVPAGIAEPIGLVQIRQLDPAFHSAEWGFAVGKPYWGSGLFAEASHLLLRFAFTVLGVQRLEARAAVPNARAHAVLRRLGAVEEGVLRRSLVTAAGEQFDQRLWTISATGWHQATTVPVVQVH